MEADQAPQVGEDIPLRRKTACQVAQINPRRRRVLLRRERRASSPARPDPRRLARKIRCSVRSNVRDRACALCDEQHSDSARRNVSRATVEFDRAR